MVHGSPLNAPVITLGEKKSLFGEKAQANEYVSYALYYWPDPANPDGPYKPIDGKKNKRLRSMDDSGRMAAFISTVCSLGRQYKLDRDPQAASRGRAMAESLVHCSGNPHAAPSEICPNSPRKPDGRRRRRHHRPLPHSRFLEALTALKCSNALTAEEWKQVDAWLNQYYTWLTTSRQGRHAHTCSQQPLSDFMWRNAPLASFLGRSHEAAQWLAEAFANMDRHIAPDGSQPEELKRAEPWQYSVYTLQAWGYLVHLAERMGDKNYRYRKTPAGASIQKAVDYLLPYHANPETWPWQMAPGQTLRCPPSLNRSRRAGHNGNAPEPRPPLKASVFPAY